MTQKILVIESGPGAFSGLFRASAAGVKELPLREHFETARSKIKKDFNLSPELMFLFNSTNTVCEK